jgi:transcription antitermination protein NusB
VGARRKARVMAVQILYQVDLTQDSLQSSMAALWGDAGIAPDTRAFATRLTQGVRDHLREIDALLLSTSEHWRIERMALVDRNILRLAAYELVFCPDIPERVTINEAIELGKRFSTGESGAFINGVLDQIRLLHGPKTAPEPL